MKDCGDRPLVIIRGRKDAFEGEMEGRKMLPTEFKKNATGMRATRPRERGGMMGKRRWEEVKLRIKRGSFSRRHLEGTKQDRQKSRMGLRTKV